MGMTSFYLKKKLFKVTKKINKYFLLILGLFEANFKHNISF